MAQVLGGTGRGWRERARLGVLDMEGTSSLAPTPASFVLTSCHRLKMQTSGAIKKDWKGDGYLKTRTRDCTPDCAATVPAGKDEMAAPKIREGIWPAKCRIA